MYESLTAMVKDMQDSQDGLKQFLQRLLEMWKHAMDAFNPGVKLEKMLMYLCSAEYEADKLQMRQQKHSVSAFRTVFRELLIVNLNISAETVDTWEEPCMDEELAQIISGIQGSPCGSTDSWINSPVRKKREVQAIRDQDMKSAMQK